MLLCGVLMCVIVWCSNVCHCVVCLCVIITCRPVSETNADLVFSRQLKLLPEYVLDRYHLRCRKYCEVSMHCKGPAKCGLDSRTGKLLEEK